MCWAIAWRVLQVRIPSRRNIQFGRRLYYQLWNLHCKSSSIMGDNFQYFVSSSNQICEHSTYMWHYISDWKKHNPFHVGLAELFHDDSRAKLLIEILNKIGLCISYDELQRINFGLMKRVINITGANRVLVSLSIDNKTLIHEAMDNFDYTEVTSPGIGGSHDTILMLFQSQNENEICRKALCKKPKSLLQNQKSLDKIPPCQEHIKWVNSMEEIKYQKYFHPMIK